MKSSHVLRAAIREFLMENYNVSITGVPISKGEKRSRGEQAPENIVSNMILSAQDLQSLIDDANSRDVLRDFSEPDAEIQRRIDLIEKRVSPGVAKLARAIVRDMSDADRALTFYNLPDETGATQYTHPIVKEGNLNKEYTIPGVLMDLAFSKRPGGRGESVGKGEALAILMFGRDSDAGKEPDLITGGRGFSIKYFENNSKTVFPGSDLLNSQNLARIVEVTDELRKIAKLKNIPAGDSPTYFSRGQARALAASFRAAIKDPDPTVIFVSSKSARAHLDPSGIGDDDLNYSLSSAEVLDLVEEFEGLWDGDLSLSGHDVISLVGSESNLTMYIVPKDLVLPGEIVKSGHKTDVKIASPMAALKPVGINAAPGDSAEK